MMSFPDQNGMTSAERSAIVNRTHRVVRERARSIQANRTQMRGLLLPMLLCSTLMILLFGALWALLDQDDLIASELPASTHHFLVMLLWFVPVSGALIAMVWFRLSRDMADDEVPQ